MNRFSFPALCAGIAGAAIAITVLSCSSPEEGKEAASPKPLEWTPVAEWLQLPEGMETLGAAHGDVAVAKNGDVYISLTGGIRAGIQVYDASGKFLRLVEGAPNDFHGFVIHEDANGVEHIYGTRLSKGNILKMTLEGEVVLDIPATAIPEEHWKVHPRTKKKGVRLTACDVAPNGDIYVTDGYSSDLVHCFTPTGEYKATFGGKEAPYNFQTLHKIAVDTRFDPPRIVGVSRTDGRVVHMSLEGEYLGDVATDLLKPAALVVQDDLLAVGEILGRVTLINEGGEIVKQLGANENEDEVGTNKTEPGKWRTGIVNAPHGVAFNSNGDLFVTEYSLFGRIVKYDRAE